MSDIPQEVIIDTLLLTIAVGLVGAGVVCIVDRVIRWLEGRR